MGYHTDHDDRDSPRRSTASRPTRSPSRRSVITGIGAALAAAGIPTTASAADDADSAPAPEPEPEDTTDDIRPFPVPVDPFETNRIVGFFGGYSRPYGEWRPEDIPYGGYTHLTVTYLNVADDGEVVSEYDGWHDRLAEISRRAPDDVTIQLSIGAGYSDNLAAAIRTDAGRRRVADSVVSMLERHDLDGVDVDLEYPADYYDDGIHNLTLALEQLRARLDASDTANTLSVTTGSGELVHDHYELDVVPEYVDYWNIMCYDYVGPWNVTEVTGHDTPLDTTKTDMARWVDETPLDADEITLGMPFYGRPFSPIPAGNRGLGEPYDGWDDTGDRIGYDQLAQEVIGSDEWSRYWSNDQSVPWLYSAAQNRFITYTDPRAVRLKGAVARNYGGAMVLGINRDTDDLSMLRALLHGMTPPADGSDTEAGTGSGTGSGSSETPE